MGENQKIPKIIHYCWFGGKEKPKQVKKCIESWKKHLSDYQIIEWSEKNFDVNQFQYTKDAYAAKKYAFVSDVARVKALLEYGGIYFDTDVEVFKSFDDILDTKCLLGFEEGNYIATSMMGAVPKYSLFQKFFELYRTLPFYDKNGKIIEGTNVTKLTDLLEEYSLRRNNCYQELKDGIKIYPKEYFSPYVYTYCTYQITEKSYCVHHFYVSWLPWHVKVKKYIKKCLVEVVGLEKAKKLMKR
ncbi:MAG: glycosyltransferase family 32 protein [Mediterraneibacter gnavus]